MSAGLLTRMFPPGVVDEVLAGCGRTEQHHRSLQARVMAYPRLGWRYMREGSYEGVRGLE